MTKVRFHGPIAGFSGAMDEMVFADRKKKNKTIAYMKKHYAPSEAQLEHRERFREAAAYAKRALSNGQRAFYELTANQKDVPAFALAVADFFNEPTVVDVFTHDYNGQIGSQIGIETKDDFGVVEVKVVLSANQGAWTETGLAVEEEPVGSGQWTYTATTEVPAGTTKVDINVSATDRPGGKGLYASQRVF